VASDLTDHNVLLTGLPRSGTTLACELLNQLPDTVALDEPMTIGPMNEPASSTNARPDPELICDDIVRKLDDIRESIATSKTTHSAHVQGRVMGAKYDDTVDREGLRTGLYTRGEIRIDKPLSPSFLLITKHPAAFTALLETLAPRFRVYAMVRNPLAVWSSWQTIRFNVRDGHHGAAERIDYELAETLASIRDRIDRQFHLLTWFYERFSTLLPDDRVIRYESLVESRGKALQAITPGASTLDEPLENRNDAAVYDRREMRLLAERLLSTEGPYWDFYSKESVRQLIDD
jgi:hypothetical protein